MESWGHDGGCAISTQVCVLCYGQTSRPSPCKSSSQRPQLQQEMLFRRPSLQRPRAGGPCRGTYKIFLWSPSINTVSNDPFETLPDDQKFDDIDIENLEEVLDEIRDSGERVLFIWDDIVNQIRSNGQLEKKCHKVLMNRRHLCGAGGCCSVIMTTQVYNKTSAPLRKVASHLFLWKTSNKKELETIYDEMVMIPRDEWFSILRHTFQRKHDFLYMDLTKNEKSMFHRNFNLLKFQSAGSEIERKAKD